MTIPGMIEALTKVLALLTQIIETQDKMNEEIASLQASLSRIRDIVGREGH